MSDGDALLRTILERPADGTARLVYADWLEDVNGGNDAARAEFIRVQCEFHTWRPSEPCIHNTKPHYKHKPLVQCRASANNPAHNCACRFELLRVRERNLWADKVRAALEANGRVWGLPVDRVTVPSKNAPRTYSETTYVVERGFVAHAFMHLVDFMEYAAALFGRHPAERVTLVDKRPSRHSGGAGDRGGFWWEPGIQHDQPRQVPFEIGEAGCKAGAWKASFHGGLMVYVHPRNKERRCPPARGFETELDALAALSQACVAYGRSLAGLSPLPAPAAVS